MTIDPISRIGSDPGTATGLVNIAAFSAYDQTFQLTSSNPAVASVPATMTVTAGFLGGGFPITTSAVAATTVVTITATGGGVSRSVQFTVYPAGTKPSLSSVTVDQRQRGGRHRGDGDRGAELHGARGRAGRAPLRQLDRRDRAGQRHRPRRRHQRDVPGDHQRGDGGHHRHDLGHTGHDAEHHADGDAGSRPRPSPSSP